MAPLTAQHILSTLDSVPKTTMARNKQLKAEEASFRQARENLLEDLDRRVKAAKAALAAASTALKKEERLSQVR